jgi:DNA polymerase
MQSLRVADGCSHCPELVANRRWIVHGYGSVESGIVFIGEAPGYKGGDLTGIPFSRDRSGLRLQRLLIELELSAESDPRIERPHLDCFLTNVVRCNPPANRTPKRTEIANCLPHLWQELAILLPTLVVPIGNVAARAVFPRLLGQPAPPITKAHALVFTQDSITIVPMRHPSRVSNADLARFRAVLAELL